MTLPANKKSSRKFFVTNALPYANGPLHLGYQVSYVCADDARDTPIILAGEKAGVAPETFFAGIKTGHEQDFAAFQVAFDHYHSTRSEENRMQ